MLEFRHLLHLSIAARCEIGMIANGVNAVDKLRLADGRPES